MQLVHSVSCLLLLLLIAISYVSPSHYFVVFLVVFAGGKNHVNDLRSDALKRIRASDNQLITKEHFIRLEGDKCQSSIGLYGDQSTTAAAAAATVAASLPTHANDYDYGPNAIALKEQQQSKSYFMEKSYYNSTDQRNRNPCDSYGDMESGGGGGNGSNGSITGNMNVVSSNANANINDKHNHSMHENDFDDSSAPLNGGENYHSGNAGGGSNASNNNDSNRLNSTHHRAAKRKHAKDDPNGDSDSNTVFHKMYKNNCGDMMMSNKFEYLSNFDGIRPRNIDEMQNCDDPHSETDYRQLTNEMNANRGGSSGGGGGGNGGGSSDDGGTNINVNYASSDDLNQTNTSEHDDKNLSGSDDESGGEFFLLDAN